MCARAVGMNRWKGPSFRVYFTLTFYSGGVAVLVQAFMFLYTHGTSVELDVLARECLMIELMHSRSTMKKVRAGT